MVWIALPFTDSTRLREERSDVAIQSQDAV
jgi:hypothetical protein